MSVSVRRLIGWTAVLSAGCAGPNFHRPDPPAAASYTPVTLADSTASVSDLNGGEPQSFAPAADISWRWWTLFQSAKLEALVERAFSKNPGIVNAQAALRQAQELVSAQRGFFYPTIA